jgi:hypothetical protein
VRGPLVAAAGSIVVSLAGLGLLVANGHTLLGDFNIDLLLVGTIYAAVGGIVLDRASGNWLGRLFLVAGWLWALTLFLGEYGWYGMVTAPGSLPGAALAVWLATWIWIPGNSLLFSWTPLLFPDGHLPSRRWRPVALVIVVGVVASVIGQAAATWPPLSQGAAAVANSIDASSEPGLVGVLANVGTIIGFIVAPTVAVAALVSRYRRSIGIARLQMRWFTVAVALLTASIMADQLATLVWPVQGVISAIALPLVPVALAVAVLRYRLYEIDRIVSRTLGWAIVTGVLVAVFAGGVVLLQAVLAPFTNENTLAVAASTLVAAALFQPLRRRVQRAVDRRFDRARYDGQRTVDAFGEQLRSEVDLRTIRASLRATAHEAVRPSETGVWLKSGRQTA